MHYLNSSRLYRGLVVVLLTTGAWQCKGSGHDGQGKDSTTVHVPGDTGLSRNADGDAGPVKPAMALREMTLADGTHVLMDTRTVIRPAEGFGTKNREITFDGEAILTIRANPGKPFIIHTRNLVIQVLGTRLHIDAFASSPGEEVDVLEGKIKVNKSYHSSTDNGQETLQGGDMVMINRDIDLMEKETLKPEERKAVLAKFSLKDSIAPRN